MPIDVPDAFPDDDDSVHESHINVLAAMGVIGGRTDGTFAPSGEVTRGQMATFLARAIPHATRAPLAANADYFADDSGDVHEPHINLIAQAGLAGGTADGRYPPGPPVRRAHMASFLADAVVRSVPPATPTPP